MLGQPDLQGLRVLVVEDELLVAMLIEEMCADLSCEVVGPVATLEEAIERSQEADCDIALVDMHLVGARADPVITELHARAIPFAIASGGGESSNDPRAAFILNKPFGFTQFAECMTVLAQQRARAGTARDEPIAE